MRRSPPASMEGPWPWCPSWRPAPGKRYSLPARSPSLSAANVASRLPPSRVRADLACPDLVAHRDLAALRQVHHRIENDLIARLDAVMHLDLRAEVARDRDLLHMSSAVLDDPDVQAVL